MNILFLTLARIDDVSQKTIYNDLLRKFKNEGHHVFVITPTERRYKESSVVSIQNGINILKIKTYNIQKTNIVEKGIGTLSIQKQYLQGLKKYFNNVSFDLVLYSTPPITFTKVIKYVKKRDNARTYLLLKDIFPQNAVDIGILKKNGLLYKYFRNLEKELYNISDTIGCMSPANADFVIKHNSFLDQSKIEQNPNTIFTNQEITVSKSKNIVREKYNIAPDIVTFVYGGNLGKPQGIDFLIKVLSANVMRKDIFFFIVGSGTEYEKINQWFKNYHPKNAKLISNLPKAEYQDLLQSCDVGLVFLDNRFTIPNFPSRILDYMQLGMPIIAATDKNTDLGKIMVENGFGLWCESKNVEDFNNLIDLVKDENQRENMGKKGHQYLIENYDVQVSYDKIIK
ncbi:glycosyl transferase [Chryseobacterium formosense]|uniref:Glycosyl transferase n=1 Tax=Chryseobacterium formosense TaxID=236814 RepID=A0A085Z7E6_9FLAO|nr:glycosyltransferase family 4 protein [Chryseobacterium formosense]KFF00360.1 glycosyl transferase [Chryseobacterium formosense]SFT33202.1 Glycosyltransferase involved in cell wall bisynthesis [Chryseobacterium formosense]